MALFTLDEWRDELDDPNELDRDEYETQTQEALRQSFKGGELFVTKGFVDVYENPEEPSPIKYQLPPGSVFLLAEYNRDYGGFRDVMLPDRGWIFTKISEYERAYLESIQQMKPGRMNRSKSSTMIQKTKDQFRQMKQRYNNRRKSNANNNNNNNSDDQNSGNFKNDRSGRRAGGKRLYSETSTSGNHPYSGGGGSSGGASSRVIIPTVSPDIGSQPAPASYAPLSPANKNMIPPSLDTTNHSNGVNGVPAYASPQTYPRIQVTTTQDFEILNHNNHNNNNNNNNQVHEHDIIPPSPLVHAPLEAIPSGITPHLTSLNSQGQLVIENNPSNTITTPHTINSPNNTSSNIITINSYNGNNSNNNSGHLDRLDTLNGSILKTQTTLSMRDTTPDHNPFLGGNTSQGSIEVPAHSHTHDRHEFSSREHSISGNSRIRRQSQWITYQPARIQKIEKPLGKELFISDELEKKDREMEEKENYTFIERIVNSNIVKQIVLFIRSHPALLTLIFIVVVGVIEGVIFADLVTDIIVAVGLLSSDDPSTSSIAFMVMAVLIFSPYFIAWSAVFQLLDKKRELWGHLAKYKAFLSVFSIAPLGVLVLMFFDVYNAFECIIIRPIYWVFTRKLFRTETFDEQGYKKLRRVSEVCAESLFQALLQLVLLVSIRAGTDDGSGLKAATVSFSIFISFIVIAFWTFILWIESSSNGLKLHEYVPIVLQGSFKFVPKLPAIERGTKTGQRVNWTVVKLDLNGLSGIMKALEAPTSSLRFIKVSSRTFKKLPRSGCKFLGRLFSTSADPRKPKIKVVVSRKSEEIAQLYDLFDTSNKNRFNFDEFARATLYVKSNDAELLSYEEVSDMFWNFAHSNEQQKVWLLDLRIKSFTSLQRLHLIDIDSPVDYAVRRQDVKLLTFCMSLGWTSEKREENIIHAITNDRLDIAHALTENEGIPIVVHVLEGMNLIAAFKDFHNKTPVSADNDKLLKVGDSQDDSSQQQQQQQQHHHTADNTVHLIAPHFGAPGSPRDHNTQALRKSAAEIFKATQLNGMEEHAVVVEVSMCEIERSTDPHLTMDEVRQFWNDKLLFIVPFKVADEIRDNPIRSLERDTTRHLPMMTARASMTNPELQQITEDIESQHGIVPPSRGLTLDEDDINGSALNIADANAPQQRPSKLKSLFSAFAHDRNTSQNLSANMLKQQASVPGNNEKNNNNNNNDPLALQANQSSNSNNNRYTPPDANNSPIGGGGMGAADHDMMASSRRRSSAAGERGMPGMPIFHQGPSYHNRRLSSIRGQLARGISIPRFLKFDKKLFIDFMVYDKMPKNQRKLAAENRLQMSNNYSADGNVTPGGPNTSNFIHSPANGSTMLPGTSTLLISSHESMDEMEHSVDGHIRTNSGDNNAPKNNKKYFKKHWSSRQVGMLARQTSADSSVNDHSSESHLRQRSKNRKGNHLAKISSMDDKETALVDALGGNSLKDDEFKSHFPTKSLSSDKKIKINETNDNDNNNNNNNNNTTGEPQAFKINLNIEDLESDDDEDDGHESEGEEHDFLGQCSISINVDQIDELETYHMKTRVKQVKIGKKRNDSIYGKIKFRVYCQALAAYFEFGRNYGDKITNPEIIRQKMERKEAKEKEIKMREANLEKANAEFERHYNSGGETGDDDDDDNNGSENSSDGEDGGARTPIPPQSPRHKNKRDSKLFGRNKKRKNKNKNKRNSKRNKTKIENDSANEMDTPDNTTNNRNIDYTQANNDNNNKNEMKENNDNSNEIENKNKNNENDNNNNNDNIINNNNNNNKGKVKKSVQINETKNVVEAKSSQIDKIETEENENEDMENINTPSNNTLVIQESDSKSHKKSVSQQGSTIRKHTRGITFSETHTNSYSQSTSDPTGTHNTHPTVINKGSMNIGSSVLVPMDDNVTMQSDDENDGNNENDNNEENEDDDDDNNNDDNEDVNSDNDYDDNNNNDDNDDNDDGNDDENEIKNKGVRFT